MSKSEDSMYRAGPSIAEVAARSGTRDIAKLSSNENPFGPSPLAIAAAKKALEAAHFYPERTDASLCAALAGYHGCSLTPQNFVVANSGVEAISLIEDALVSPGERAIICPPCFGAYAASLGRKGVQIDEVPLKEGSYDVDTEAVLAAVTPRTRLVYLCNPNNPTGTWFGPDVLEQVLNALPEHVTLIYDEVYYHFATREGLPDALAHVHAGRNLAIVHSFSKAYGLAGMRIGYTIAPAPLIAKIQACKRSFHVNTAALAAAEAALRDADHLDRTVANNHEERERLATALTERGLEVTPSQANFVMFACPPGTDAKGLTGALIAKGVMVRPAFYLPGHIRVTIGLPDQNDRFLAALEGVANGA